MREENDTYYSYAGREGVWPISWEDFHGLCKALAAAAAKYRPQVILAVGRGGYYPGALLAHLLQVEIYPIRLSRRVYDRVVHDQPRWLVEPPAMIRDRRVLVVDEISGSGETLRMVIERAELESPAAVRCAVLYAHTSGAEVPDYIGVITDALLINPWDREIYRDGAFHIHPEYAAALQQQGLLPDSSFPIQATEWSLARGGDLT
jgi:hypoxanthine phosphoribosyltransferase